MFPIAHGVIGKYIGKLKGGWELKERGNRSLSFNSVKPTIVFFKYLIDYMNKGITGIALLVCGLHLFDVVLMEIFLKTLQWPFFFHLGGVKKSEILCVQYYFNVTSLIVPLFLSPLKMTMETLHIKITEFLFTSNSIRISHVRSFFFIRKSEPRPYMLYFGQVEHELNLVQYFRHVQKLR